MFKFAIAFGILGAILACVADVLLIGQPVSGQPVSGIEMNQHLFLRRSAVICSWRT